MTELEKLQARVEYLTGVCDGLVRRIDAQETIIRRHDRTLRIIHSGLHDTSDPEFPGGGV